MILAILKLGMYIIGRWDKPLPLRRKCWYWIFLGAALEFTCVRSLTVGKPLEQTLLWIIIGGCLLLACVTDCLLCQVYNFTWWIALAAAIPLLWRHCEELTQTGGVSLQNFCSLLFFCALQFLLFQHTYGRADCYAFCICAAVEAAIGFSTAGFLSHMLVSYVLLFAVQLFRRNINRKGNLRKPVPFLPYITVSFWIIVLLYTYFG